MKKFIYLILALTLLLLSSCTDIKNDTTDTNSLKDKFLGRWVCEVYDYGDKKVGDSILVFKKENDTYHGILKRITDDGKGTEFDDFTCTDKELLLIKNNRVIQRNEYFFDNDKLIIENKVYTKK